MAEIKFKQVTKSFGETTVIKDLDLTIKDAEFTVLVGPSGCGKTTLLRMIAGIGPATGGRIFLDGEDITDLPPARRNVAMVFQNYALYPTMSVRDNIEFGLKNNKVPRNERQNLVGDVSRIVGLAEYLDRMPSTLSGGQRQRVALARAMVKKPKVFLMDEPLSNLDAKLRVAMRTELIELHERLGTTFVYVTHDQVEAMSMADEIVLMDKGIIQQEASPEEIYSLPNNIFTAQFIGTPPMNILPLESTPFRFGFRPEKVFITSEGEKAEGLFSERGKVLTREMLGSEVLYKIELREGIIMVKLSSGTMQRGDAVSITVHDEDIYFFDGRGDRISGQEELVRCRELFEMGKEGSQ